MNSRAKPAPSFTTEGSNYAVERLIGSGAYGSVAQAVDNRDGSSVAIKKIARAFAAMSLVRRTLREIRILREVQHVNIVRILDMYPAEASHGTDIYLVMDLMETDLHQIIHSTQKLTEQHHQYFTYQLLSGLKYLHSHSIIHRDLKPSNLLVNANCLLKIADFGMARSFKQCVRDEGTTMTYVSTRWYRAPEILFSLIDYDTKVDIWSAGCILAELIQRRQLFPGRDAHVQVKIIVFYLGKPEDEVMSRITSELVRTWIENCGERTPLPWSTILPKASSKATALLGRMMQIAPWLRCSAEEALAEPFLERYSREPNVLAAVEEGASFGTGGVDERVDIDSIEKMNPNELHETLLKESLHFRKEKTPISEMAE